VPDRDSCNLLTLVATMIMDGVQVLLLARAISSAVVDVFGETIAVLDEKLAQFGVVDEPAGAREQGPCAAAVPGPVFLD